MSVLNLLPNNYEPVSNGASEEQPTTFSDVVSAGFDMTRDNYNANSSARLISELQDERSSIYSQIEGKPLFGKNYSQANAFLSIGATQDSDFSPLFETGVLDFLRPDVWGWAQRLHKDDTYVNLHIKELKQKDPEKYKNLLTNEEIQESAREKARASKAEFENVASRASEDSAFYGGIVGSMGGALTDPINIMTMPLGAGASGGVLKTIGVEAGIQAGVETLTQPKVYSWQKEIGEEYGLGDAAVNVFGAAVLGGGVAGVIRGAKPTAQATFAMMQSSTTFNSLQKQAAGYMSRVAHFREANPNPKVASELHTDTVTTVNAVVRAGDNPSTANLPMTSKQFDEIDTTASGLTNSQKKTLEDVERLKSISNIYKKGFHGTQGILQGDIRRSMGTYGDAFYISNSKESAARFGRDVFVDDSVISTTGEIIQRSVRESDVLDSSNVFEIDTSALKIKDFNSRVDFNNSWGLDANDFPKFAELEGVDAIFIKDSGELAVYNTEKIKVLGMDLVKKGESSSSYTVPSRIEELPQPLNNSEMDELLTRLESIDNTKAVNENFRQLVETNGDTVLTLEDGTTKTLRQLNEELAEDENFITEISTCAIG